MRDDRSLTPPAADPCADSGAELVQIKDADLLEGWAKGDRDAGAALLDRYIETLQRFFASRVPYAAEDLTQATLLACVEGRARLREHSSFKAYLLGIARNQLYAYYRRRGTERDKNHFNTTSRYQAGAGPSTLAIKRNEDDLLMSAMRALPARMQEILELAYWEDLSAVELADVLAIPVNAVHNRLHRAKQRLRETLALIEQSSGP